MAEVEPLRVQAVDGFLHLPAATARDGLVLTHGAGGNCHAPLLVAVAHAFAAAGLLVFRCNLPFRRLRSYGPPLPVYAAEDRQGLRAAALEMRSRVSGKIFLGGHSYGGRQASILASEESAVADALLLLSYPLHPPKKPEQLRTTHFSDLLVPSFFVHGSKDPFGSVDEMLHALTLIRTKTELRVVEGGEHDLKRGAFDVADTLVRPFLAFNAENDSQTPRLSPQRST